MSDFIKKDVIEKEIKKWDLPTQEFFNELIDSVSTIDAISVVRCRQCKFWKNDGVHIYGMCKNPNIGSVKMDTDFCSFGVRKDGVSNA